MAFQLMYVTVITALLIVFLDVCHSKTFVTYSFPTDSCNAPTYIVDEDTTTFMTFDGDLQNRDCRQMSFSIPKSIFYRYRMFVRQHYFDSPKCQTMLQYKIYRDTEYEYEYYYNNDGEVTGEGCEGVSYSNSDLSEWFYNFDSVSFEIKKSHTSNYGTNRHDGIILEEIAIEPDKPNDTFKFQIDAELEYNYDVIGGLAGGIAGFLVLCGLTTYVCISCRRRKRKTGRYCCTCVTNRNINAGGLLAECSVNGLLLCSCILCRHQQHYERMQSSDSLENVSTEPDDSKTDMVTRWESPNALKDQKTVPLIQCDN